jgi:hypothetical protein
MGTTSTALQTQSGVRIGFVAAIEGFDYLLTDQLDVGPVITAWAGTGWTQALPGLKVRGTIRQAIVPWATSIDVPTLTLEVQSDEADTFGIAVWKSKPTFRTRLTQPFEAEPDGTGFVNVNNTVGSPSIGQPVYLGNRRLIYSAASATQFTLASFGAGTHFPFGADAGNHFSDAAPIPAQQNWDAADPPSVQDVPPSWIGRKVALYLHRIVGEVWDTRAEAQLEFAGKIVSLDDDPAAGATIIGLEDLRGSIRDCVLLKRQWTGRVKEGIRLTAGMTFYAEEVRIAEGASQSTVLSGPFTVVSSGASGNDEIDEGYYPLGVFLESLNQWAANDATLAGEWAFELKTMDQGPRLVVRANFGTTATRLLKFYATSRHVLEFLGFHGMEGGYDGTGIADRPFVAIGDSRVATSVVIVSGHPPFRTKPFQNRNSHNDGEGTTVDLESTDGEWVTHADFLPAGPFDAWRQDGEDWSFVALGGRLFFGKFSSATQLTNMSVSKNFAGYAEGESRDGLLGRTVEDDDGRLDIVQVVVLAGSFTNIVTRLLASTDGRGVNHATFDVFSKGMGCPGIPWSVLGDEWLESVRELDQADAHESMMIVLDRPRKLLDILLPEFLLRFAWLLFKAGHYVMVSPPTPNPLSPDHVLDDDNKAAPANETDLLVSATNVTKEHLCNIIKVEYNLAPDGKYRDSLTVRDETSVATYGETQACSISAANSYSDAAGTGASVEALAASLIARVVPAFGRPLKTVRRVIAPSHYHVTPGDTVNLSDQLVRDPTSGRRGITNRGCICMASSHTYGAEGGTPFGDVELLFTDEDRTFPLAPAAEVDTGFSGTVDGITFTSGYAATAAGGPALKTRAHSYSQSADPVDCSRFANSDLVRICEIDPSNPAAPIAWDRQLAASSAVDAVDNYVRLTADLASPAYSSSRQYRIQPQRFSTVQDSQELVSYLAGSDDLVQDLVQPNSFGDNVIGVFARTTPDVFPCRLIPDESVTEGRPLSPGTLFDHLVNLNTLVSRVTAPHMPMQHNGGTPHSVQTTTYRLINLFPFFVGLTPHPAATRRIFVAPILSIGNAAQTATCRVTSSKFPPTGGNSQPPRWTGPKRQLEFLRTGATSEAAIASQSMPVVMAEKPGWTWISVELKTTSGAALALFRGFHVLNMGPVI